MSKLVILGIAVACAACITVSFKAFGYVPPENSYTVKVVAACPSEALANAGMDYTALQNGYGMVTNVYYTQFNTPTPTNKTHGVVSSVIVMHVKSVTGNPADGTVLVHGNAAKTNVIGVIHR